MKAPPLPSASLVSVEDQHSATVDEVDDLPAVQADPSLFISTHLLTAPADFARLTETATDRYDSIGAFV